MTKAFECDGCGTQLPIANLSADIMLTHEQSVEIDLCDICTKALKQFLKDRYNNSKKGINTGLSFNYSTFTGTTTPSNTLFVGDISQEACQDHKRKTGQIKGKKRVSKK